MKTKYYLHTPIWGTSRKESIALESKEVLLPRHKYGMMTPSGYGSKIPTEIMVKYNNRWYRVYCRIYSNIGTLYIEGKFGAYDSFIVYDYPL